MKSFHTDGWGGELPGVSQEKFFSTPEMSCFFWHDISGTAPEPRR